VIVAARSLSLSLSLCALPAPPALRFPCLPERLPCDDMWPATSLWHFQTVFPHPLWSVYDPISIAR
jgi:hypothetical protein